VLRQVYLYRGSPVRILPLFAWVAIDVLLWGFFTRYVNSVAAPRLDFVPAVLGAVMMWDFLIRVMQGLTTTFFEDVWSRNFLNVFASPLSITEYVSGLVVSSVASSAVGLLVMLIMASVVFGLSFFVYGLAIIPLMLVLFLFGVTLGILSCAVVIRLGPAAEWLIWPLPAMLSPLACVFYPLSALPHWLQIPARMMPPAYVFEAMRGIVAGRGFSGASFAIAVVMAIVYVMLAGWFFAHIYRYAVRMGLIARYSAESVS
jgi:ABC-2 type transport system permease protein